MPDTPTVMFVCVHNAGRSQMAAGWLRHLAGNRVRVLSGGSTPAEQINPVAVEAMREVGIGLSEQQPRPWTEETLEAADVVVTMGCGDACPVIPGKRPQRARRRVSDTHAPPVPSRRGRRSKKAKQDAAVRSRIIPG